MSTLENLTLDAKPAQILTRPWNALLTIAKINIAGGRVISMVKVPGKQGRWRLSIRWPEPERHNRLGWWHWCAD